VLYLGGVSPDISSLAEAPEFLQQRLAESGYLDGFAFLAGIPAERIVEIPGGEDLYCFYPLDDKVSFSINRYIVSEANNYAGESGELLYHSEQGEPILLRCNVSDIIPDAQLLLIDSSGKRLRYVPQLSLRDGRVYIPQETVLLYDATHYARSEEWDED
jgi:hypothetical protein